jgi:hypothetical protein
MNQTLTLAPRYRLDDESIWLEGVDPSQHYWIRVNGDPQLQIVIPGLCVATIQELKNVILKVRSMQAGDMMRIQRIADSFTLHCVGNNCYAIEGRVRGALTWHLFDKEALESLLLTSHPDWIPSEKGMELGRNHLINAFSQPAYAH